MGKSDIEKNRIVQAALKEMKNGGNNLSGVNSPSSDETPTSLCQDLTNNVKRVLNLLGRQHPQPQKGDEIIYPPIMRSEQPTFAQAMGLASSSDMVDIPSMKISETPCLKVDPVVAKAAQDAAEIIRAEREKNDSDKESKPKGNQSRSLLRRVLLRLFRK